MLLGACTGGDDQLLDGEDDALAAGVHEFVDVRPGGTASLGDQIGVVGEITSERHLFVAPGPDGPINVFDVSFVDRQEVPQRCLVIAEQEDMSWVCANDDEPLGGPRDDNLLMSGSDTDGSPSRTVLQFAGPPETTHFVVTTGNRRLGIAAVEGIAVLAVRGKMCQVLPTAIEAWAGDELLNSSGQRDWCD